MTDFSDVQIGIAVAVDLRSALIDVLSSETLFTAQDAINKLAKKYEVDPRSISGFEVGKILAEFHGRKIVGVSSMRSPCGWLIFGWEDPAYPAELVMYGMTRKELDSRKPTEFTHKGWAMRLLSAATECAMYSPEQSMWLINQAKYHLSLE
jgi:hypothetical protein